MSDIAVRVHNLGKLYRIGAVQPQDLPYHQRLSTLLKSPFSYFVSTLHAPEGDEILWALREVSFVVKPGDVLGIVGHNGAGKSTLLKILSQITHPTTGRAEIYGRVGSLLEVGTGFHQELTGRENVYMNGAILGMNKSEIDSKFDEIVDFSGVEKYIDTPVKRYSSGMNVRLAFAVAAHLDPEILVIDEVLAVGDAQFQRKCLGKMGEISKGGRTVLMVSHNMASIEALCNRAIVIDKGRLIFDGEPDMAVSYYLSQQDVIIEGGAELANHANRVTPQKNAVFKYIRLLNPEGVESRLFSIGEPITFEITVELGERSLQSPIIALAIMHRGITVCVLSTLHMQNESFTLAGRTHVRCRWETGLLAPGNYNIGRLGIKAGVKADRLDHIENVLSFDIVDRDIHGTGKVTVPGTLLIADGRWDFDQD